MKIKRFNKTWVSRFFSSAIIAVSSANALAVEVVDRYATLEPVLSQSQVSPLQSVVSVRFSSELHTIADALNYVLKRSGYQMQYGDMQSSFLKYLPLPESQREMNQVSIENAVSTLLGPSWLVSKNDVLRTLTVTLNPKYQSMWSKDMVEKAVYAHTALISEKGNANTCALSEKVAAIDFVSGKTHLNELQKTNLRNLYLKLKAEGFGQYHFTVVGKSSPVSQSEEALGVAERLSMRRAFSVAAALASAGVDVDVIHTRSILDAQYTDQSMKAFVFIHPADQVDSACFNKPVLKAFEGKALNITELKEKSVWEFSAKQSVADVFNQWSEQSDYQIVWRNGVEDEMAGVEMYAAAIYEGPFESVVKQFVDHLNKEEVPLNHRIYENRVLELWK